MAEGPGLRGGGPGQLAATSLETRTRGHVRCCAGASVGDSLCCCGFRSPFGSALQTASTKRRRDHGVTAASRRRHAAPIANLCRCRWGRVDVQLIRHSMARLEMLGPLPAASRNGPRTALRTGMVHGAIYSLHAKDACRPWSAFSHVFRH